MNSMLKNRVQSHRIVIIAGIGNHNELGQNNELLWRLPADLKFFKQKTQGHPIIMGRKTFLSIGRVLPHRLNIVISSTKQEPSHHDSLVWVTSFERALNEAKKQSHIIYIIGGSSIYKAAMPLADELMITHVHHDFPNADVSFPKIDPLLWKNRQSIHHHADLCHAYDYTFSHYTRYLT
jgi:dihydrofolate reductase